LESTVNLAAAVVALWALRLASRPADDEFTFGYSKVEYFASGFEGGMILLAAVGIFFSALPRLIHPQPLEQLGSGPGDLGLRAAHQPGHSNGFDASRRRYHSITLEADARHLMTDVWTTGVI
jgi:divalent metal cation (Fe/Co/Zn/Cd) transporter